MSVYGVWPVANVNRCDDQLFSLQGGFPRAVRIGRGMAFLRTIKGKLAEANPAPRFEPELWRRRLATLAGGVLVGLVALGFAHFGDLAQRSFSQMQARVWWFPLIWTPALFILFAAVTIRMVPEARGSGIP